MKREVIGPVVSASQDVDAPPSAVFDVIADPARHQEFDGSGTVRPVIGGARRLSLGSRFGMRMRMGLPYVMRNTVVEFEPDRRLAWSTVTGQIWRYELEPLDGGARTRVTETWDSSRSPIWPLYRVLGFDHYGRSAITRTLPRLAEVVTADRQRSARP